VETEKVIVTGAGPAGLAAAGQLHLYGIAPAVYEFDEPGGLLLNAFFVVNYPGFPEGINGRNLAGLFTVPERLINRKVTGIWRENGLYRVETSGGVVSSQAVIVASGTVPRKIPGISGDRVHYGVKHLTSAYGRTAAIIGGGDAALDYAMSLSSDFTVNVYARDNFSSAVPHLMAKVCELSSVTLHPGSLPKYDFSEDVIVVAAGRLPAIDFLSGELLSSPPDDGSFHMCGDCRNGLFRQTAIAVGDGVKAAMKTADYLKRLDLV